MPAVKDNLEAWRALITVADTGSLTRTAMLLDLPLAKTSRMIASLEEALGFAVLDRTGRPIRPTPRGAALVSAVRPLLEGFDDAWNVYRESDEQQIFSFSAPIDLARLYFSDLLVRYSEDRPQVSFSILPERTAEAVRNGEVDIAVINRLPANADGLNIREYVSNATPVLASPAYLREYGFPALPQDLVHHKALLLQTCNAGPTTHLWKNGRPSPLLRWASTVVTHDQANLRSLLLAGRGLTVDLYAGHVLAEIKSGAVVPVLPGWERAPWHMCVVTSTERERQSRELRELADYICEESRRDFMRLNTETRHAVSAARKQL